MLELRDHHWSIPGVVDGQKTPGLKLLESPEFVKFSGGRGLQITRLPDTWLTLENGPGWTNDHIPTDARKHLPERGPTLGKSRDEFIDFLSDQYYHPMCYAAECFASDFDAPPPDLHTEFVLLWDDTKWPIDWCLSYPSMFFGHARILGPHHISASGFSILDLSDGEYVLSHCESGEPLCITATLDPLQSNYISFSARLPALSIPQQNEVVLLLSEILNTAAVAWKTRSRRALLLRHAEYIFIRCEESTRSAPIPTISITNVQHDPPLHDHDNRHPWGFTFLNLSARNLTTCLTEIKPPRWAVNPRNVLVPADGRRCDCCGLVESPEPQSEPISTDGNTGKRTCPFRIS